MKIKKTLHVDNQKIRILCFFASLFLVLVMLIVTLVEVIIRTSISSIVVTIFFGLLPSLTMFLFVIFVKGSFLFIKKIMPYYMILYLFLIAIFAGGLRSISFLTILVIPIVTVALEEKILKSSIFAFLILTLLVVMNSVKVIDSWLMKISIFSENSLIQPNIMYITFFYSLFVSEFIFSHILLEETKKQRELIELKNRELFDLSRQKIDFFINITHEMKTPLTLIKNYYSRYIKKVGETEELKILKTNIDKLQRDMINFLDIEKMEKGQVFYDHSEIFCLSDLLLDKMPFFIGIAEYKNIDVSFSKIEKDIFIKADPYAIDRIINNLYDNVLKYTDPKGKINIELQIVDDNIKFTIKDNGIGISSDKIDLIFLPYWQLSNQKRNIDGIGIGLHIVKKIVDSLNGEITVESELGNGTTFTIILPQHKNKVVDTKNINVSQPISRSIIKKVEDTTYDKSKNTILIVEDNSDLLFYMKIELEEFYNIFVAENGLEAIEKIKQIEKLDMIISDIMMDKMAGDMFLEEIKKNKDINDIPFIFITAKSTSIEKTAGINQGAIAYLTKPFDIEELKAIIHSIFKNRELQIEKLKEDLISLLNSKGKNNLKPDSIENIFSKYKITDAEKNICLLLMQGMQNKEIAVKLKLSESYVGKKISEILKKTFSSNRVELIKKLNKL